MEQRFKTENRTQTTVTHVQDVSPGRNKTLRGRAAIRQAVVRGKRSPVAKTQRVRFVLFFFSRHVGIIIYTILHFGKSVSIIYLTIGVFLRRKRFAGSIYRGYRVNQGSSTYVRQAF